VGGINVLEARLKLFELQYLLRPTRVMVVKDSKNLYIDGQSIELQKGVEIEIPYWLASQLVKEGLVKIVESPLSLEDIARIHFSVISAKTPSDLEQLPQYFYQEAKTVIQELGERAKKELDPALLEERHRMLQYLVEIIDKRLTILLQSLRSPTSIAEITSRLTPEEEALLNYLSNALKTWREKILPRATV
jgi:DNA replication factor GINS